MSNIISPSLLSANFSNLGKDMEMLNKSEADWLHLDIMDGVFVPNISFGFPVLEHIARLAKKPMDAHLMIVEPDKFVPHFKDLGTYMLTVHYEACPHLHRTIQNIKNNNMKAGVVLNPHTPVSVLEDIVHDVDMVLLMSVNPGYGGQSFIEHTVTKVASLKEMLLKKNSNALIEIDGGVNFETGARLVKQGADVLVSGSFIFNADDPYDTIHRLKML